MDLLYGSRVVGVGIGGTTRVAQFRGSKVFIKQMPLTAEQNLAPTATRSWLDLPVTSHYGLVSPSHGVGRELAAHQLTSAWVWEREADFFPLLLDWRIADVTCDVDFSEFDVAEVRQRWGRYWPKIRREIDSLRASRSSLLLVLEYVPETLASWLRSSVASRRAGTIFSDAVAQILEATTWMKSRHFQHFDLHPGNILVRDGTLLFSDFGLALHSSFVLSSAEENAMSAHGDFDRDTALMHLFHWLLYEMGFESREQRLKLLRSFANGSRQIVPDPVREALGDSAGLLMDHAHTVVAMTDMYDALVVDVTATDYGRTTRATRW